MGEGCRVEGKTMRAALYVRVSTAEQKNHGISVENQIDSLTKYCAENHYSYELYNDAGHSAHKKYTSRPSLLRLMGDVEKGKIDIILFTKLDRWFRSVADYYQVQAVLDEHKVPWKAIQEDYETITSSGRFKVNIMLSVAQSEAERTSERIKNIHAYRKEQGKFTGTPPTGYKVVNSWLVKDEETREGMEKLFECLLNGEGMTAALRKVKEYGVTRNPGHMWRTIKSPAYHGEVYKCEPYLSKEDHMKILGSIKSFPPQTKKHTYIFSKLVVCGYCGKRMVGTTDINKNKNGNVQILKYRCPAYCDTSFEHHYCSISEHTIEEYLVAHLDSLYKDFKIDVKARKKQSNRESLLKRKKSLSAKLERLKTLFVEGDISKSEYDTQKSQIQSELDSIVIETGEIVQIPSYWKDLYDALDVNHKQKFWHKILTSITVTNETKTHPSVSFKVDF